MANKTVFRTGRQLPATDTLNRAGGIAYNLSDEEALCQYMATGTFNGTFYADAEQIYQDIKACAERCSAEVIAKAAVYGREKAKMKDLPAYLVAVLSRRKNRELLEKVFPRVINDAKMLCNFVQIIRSGAVGSTSFGSTAQRLIRRWFHTRTPDDIFAMSFGHQNPSLSQIIALARPRPVDDTARNLFAYLRGREFNIELLPEQARAFEVFKKDQTAPLPRIPFRALTNCDLNQQHWCELAKGMGWDTLRQNLNNLQRHGVFDDKETSEQVITKLEDVEEVRRRNIFPYQLLTTYNNTTDVPMRVRIALQKALDVATQNVPTFNDVAVCIDTSGSMNSAATGRRGSVTSVTTCVDVAVLIAAAILRKNNEAKIVSWSSDAQYCQFNPLDSVVTNCELFKQKYVYGGGTNMTSALQLLNRDRHMGNLVIFVSDNESWIESQAESAYVRMHNSTGVMQEWNKYVGRNPKARLVCIDITPNHTSQAPSQPNILNIGGFSDSVFDVIGKFVAGDGTSFVDAVKSTEI